MARLYADEHFPLNLAKALRALGHDVLTVQEAGKADQRIPDEEMPIHSPIRAISIAGSANSSLSIMAVAPQMV